MWGKHYVTAIQITVHSLNQTFLNFENNDECLAKKLLFTLFIGCNLYFICICWKLRNKLLKSDMKTKLKEWSLTHFVRPPTSLKWLELWQLCWHTPYRFFCLSNSIEKHNIQIELRINKEGFFNLSAGPFWFSPVLFRTDKYICLRSHNKYYQS